MDFGTEDLTFDFPHTLGEIEVDATPSHIKVHDMKFTCWNLPKDVQVQDLNLGSKYEPKMVKLNADLDDPIVGEVEALLQDYKDMFAWSYKELIGISHALLNTKLSWTPQSHELIKLSIEWILTMLQSLNMIWISCS